MVRNKPIPVLVLVFFILVARSFSFVLHSSSLNIYRERDRERAGLEIFSMSHLFYPTLFPYKTDLQNARLFLLSTSRHNHPPSSRSSKSSLSRFICERRRVNSDFPSWAATGLCAQSRLGKVEIALQPPTRRRCARGANTRGRRGRTIYYPRLRFRTNFDATNRTALSLRESSPRWRLSGI